MTVKRKHVRKNPRVVRLDVGGGVKHTIVMRDDEPAEPVCLDHDRREVERQLTLIEFGDEAPCRCVAACALIRAYGADPADFVGRAPGDWKNVKDCVDALASLGIVRVIARGYLNNCENVVDTLSLDPGGLEVPDALTEKLERELLAAVPQPEDAEMGGRFEAVLYPVQGLARVTMIPSVESEDDMPPEEKVVPDRLLKKLRTLGVTSVTGGFDGSGDSGQVEEVNFWGSHQVDRSKAREELTQDVDEQVCDLLPGGWELNRGSSGAFSLDVATGVLSVTGARRSEEDGEPVVIRWRC